MTYIDFFTPTATLNLLLDDDGDKEINDFFHWLQNLIFPTAKTEPNTAILSSSVNPDGRIDDNIRELYK
jgi:hypothetical protein